MLVEVLVASALSQALEQTNRNAWTFSDMSDPLTDVRRGFAAIESDGGDLLVVKCDSSGPRSMYVHLISRAYLGSLRSNGNREIAMRVDQQAPQSFRWRHDGAAALTLDDNTTSRVVAALGSGQSIFMRATDYNYRSHDYRFSLVGAREAIAQAYSACGAGSPPFPAAPTSSASGASSTQPPTQPATEGGKG